MSKLSEIEARDAVADKQATTAQQDRRYLLGRVREVETALREVVGENCIQFDSQIIARALLARLEE